MATKFLITIDTEGDDIWTRSPKVTTRNALFLGRFQDLCETYGFKPTYLVNYEMAIDQNFVEFAKSTLSRNKAEIGTHVHSWNSPPLSELDDWNHHSYIFEYPDELIHAKLAYLTDLLTETFGERPESHRAGRWGFDQRVAEALIKLGYRTDCSVTPGVSWKKHLGSPNGQGGPDFFGYKLHPYYIDSANSTSPKCQLLEVPVTIKPNYKPGLEKLHNSIEQNLSGKILRKVAGPSHSWLRPTGTNTDEMIGLVGWAKGKGLPALEFMLHSSELMPGGSPKFRTSEDIDHLYKSLNTLFRTVAEAGCEGMTLREFRASWSTDGC